MSQEQGLLQSILELMKQNRNLEALEALEKSHPSPPFASSFDFAKAMVYCGMGRQSEGARVLSRLVQRDPGFPDAMEVLNQLKSEGWTGVESPAPAPAAGRQPLPEYYGPCRLNPSTMVAIATSLETWNEILAFQGSLASDSYVAYVESFYRDCLARYGRHWHYLDAVNVLYTAAKLLRPARYLEIGVRTGRSVCTVARAFPDVDIHAFDMWIQGYAGMENPGPAFVRRELQKHGHRGTVRFIDGDSHVTLPAFFRENPGLEFNLITVDGDHSEAGAADDLGQVIPRLAVGGILVMDDIAHPAHPYLLKVWRDAVARHPGLVTHEFTELGYGVAFAIKKG